MERKFFEDNELIHAVIECNFDKVKELVKTKFSAPIYDIGGWEKQCPVFIISRSYQVIFENNPGDKTFSKRSKENEKILSLFKSQFDLGNIDDLMIEDYTSTYFDCEEDRVSNTPEESTNFDITQNLDSALYEEITGHRRYAIIKKLCELGANPYSEDEDEESIIDFTSDDIQMGETFVKAMFNKPQNIYTIDNVAEIIATARNIQNYEIMTNYTM